MTESFPSTEIYGLSSQIRRASVSVAGNIAEGAGRGSKRDFRHFLMNARGSICEVQTQLVLAGKLQFARSEKLAEIEPIANEVGRMLNGLIQSMTEGPSSSSEDQELTTKN